MPAQLNRRRALALLGGGFGPAGLWAGLKPGLASAQTPPPAASGTSASDANPGDTLIRFANTGEGRAILGAVDAYVRAAGDVQRRAIMQRVSSPSEEEFLDWTRAAVQPWSDRQMRELNGPLERAAEAFQRLHIPLPPEVLLVRTDGRDMTQLPYTRAHAIVLPDNALAPGQEPGQLAQLLAHELWHVASRHAPDLATRLYRELGFEPVPRLSYPASWRDLRIANPDAPEHEHAMTIKLGSREALVTPVTVARKRDVQPGETFFQIMDLRLLEIAPQADGRASVALLRNGEPVWHPMQGPHNFVARLGGNTGYIIHPEEALADNIALLATKRTARNPALLERIAAALKSASTG